MPNLLQVVTSEAPVVFRSLNGLICLNKPADRHVDSIRYLVAKKICKELNELDVRPPVPYVSIVGDTSKELTVNVSPSYADNPLVTGPRYIPREVKLSIGNWLGFKTSGVLVLGINEGIKKTKFLQDARLVRTYLLKGRLGEMTHNCFADGRLLYRGRYDFITRGAMDQITATMQTLHRKLLFDLCAMDGQSQTAYEVASSGLLRPFKSYQPVVYSLKCTSFTPPDFTIEVLCINETEDFLTELISQLGAKLRSAAVCTQIKCIRFSHFTLDDALLMKHWTLQNLVDSIQKCDEKYKKIKKSVSSTLVDLKKQETAAE